MPDVICQDFVLWYQKHFNPVSCFPSLPTSAGGLQRIPTSRFIKILTGWSLKHFLVRQRKSSKMYVSCNFEFHSFDIDVRIKRGLAWGGQHVEADPKRGQLSSVEWTKTDTPRIARIARIMSMRYEWLVAKLILSESYETKSELNYQTLDQLPNLSFFRKTQSCRQSNSSLQHRLPTSAAPQIRELLVTSGNTETAWLAARRMQSHGKAVKTQDQRSTVHSQYQAR